jgi:hypothetical protein
MFAIKSNNPGVPVLTNAQYNMIQKHKEKHDGKLELKTYLESKSGFIGQRAVTNTGIKADGSIYQRWHYQPIKIVDNQEDFGAFYDLNAYCTAKGGNMEPRQGYSIDDITRSIFPNNAVFQCTSQVEPFYVKIQQLDNTNYYEIYIKYGTIAQSDFRPVEEIITASEAGTFAGQQAAANSNSPQSGQLGSSLSALLMQKMANQMDTNTAASSQIIQAVSSSTPEAMMDTANDTIRVYWIKSSGSCDQAAVIKTAKYSNDRHTIENYLNCAGSVKSLGNTPLPAVVDESIKSQALCVSIDVVFYGE